MSLVEAETQDLAPEAPAAAPEPPARSAGAGAAGNDHKAIGSCFIALSLLFLVAGGALALVMRGQLSSTDSTLLTDREYRTLFTFHGSFLIFLFLIPAWIGVATAIVPLQIGSGRLAFPRLQTMALWLTVGGGALVAASPFIHGARHLTSGWALDQPIPTGAAFKGKAIEFFVLGIALVLAATVLATANLITTIAKFRAPGLTTKRIPLFSWSVVVSGAIILLATPMLISILGMLYVDHHYGSHLFSGFTGSRGGNPLMWPKLFWFGAYPLLFALLVPALGLASDVIPVFAGRPIADRLKAMAAMGAVAVLAFFGWGSELQDFKRSRLFFAAGALVVLAPIASLVLNWLLTLRAAGKERGVEDVRSGFLRTPMLMVMGLVGLLAAGLAAGTVSALWAGRSLHANYWQVGEQHLLFFAPATVAIVAAVHYWGPKLWGRQLSDAAGKLEALLLVGGAFLSFLPALVLGLQDMPTHTSTYTSSDGWQAANVVMSLGSAVLTLGVVVFALDLLFSVVLRRGRPAPADPWGGHTLEWTAPTPVPRHNFDRLPEVRSAVPALDLHASAAALGAGEAGH